MLIRTSLIHQSDEGLIFIFLSESDNTSQTKTQHLSKDGSWGLTKNLLVVLYNEFIINPVHLATFLTEEAASYVAHIWW